LALTKLDGLGIIWSAILRRFQIWSEFEYLMKLGCKRQNMKNPGAFEKFSPHQIEWFEHHLERN
jgi:hypothetical protein